jgi:phage terminase large subunit-like protein
VALVGETYDQVREVMVFGDSGILASSPPDRRPEWHAARRRLIWPNGAEAVACSAHDPEAMRGPQFDAAWADELAKWEKGQEAWDMLQFALRLGDDPRVCVTTTPRNADVLKDLLEAPSTVVTQAPTEANRVNLAESFLAEVRARYAGTRLGLQELDGQLLTDVEGALWQSEEIEALRVRKVPALDRIVVGVDPAAGGADECGIVVVGAVTQGPPEDWCAYVLADHSVRASPIGWAEVAVKAWEAFEADRIVAEANQGGQMVAQTLRTVDAMAPVKLVHAARGKAARAEPVAALYEQGRVRHVRGLGTLEDQMVQMTRTGFQGDGSPDRLDALVWAVHELMIGPCDSYRRPGIRAL